MAKQKLWLEIDGDALGLYNVNNYRTPKIGSIVHVGLFHPLKEKWFMVRVLEIKDVEGITVFVGTRNLEKPEEPLPIDTLGGGARRKKK